MSSVMVNLKALGLHTFSNQLDLPQGALSQADNVVINRDGVIESRRGFAYYGNAMGSSPTTDKAKQLLIYKDRLIRHYNNVLEYDSDSNGTWVALPGTYTEVETGLRIKGAEVNGNFYFTTTDGIKKISSASANDFATATISNAGGVKALDFSYRIAEDEGFLSQDSKVAYRIVWGIKDKNNNLILGVPSNRIVASLSIKDLLITDFNNLLLNLDTAALVTVPAQDLSDTDYLSSLKIPLNSSAAVLRANLLALATKLDADLVVTDFSTITAPDTLSAIPTTQELISMQEYYDTIISTLNDQPTSKISANARAALTAQNGLAEFVVSTQTAAVTLTITLPEDVTTQHFYQVYRTTSKQSEGVITLDDIDPGDECGLVYESNPTSTDITNRYVEFTDITPDSFIGANLYTNEISGEGILEANEMPPLAKDIVTFKGSTFYANTKTKHRLNMSLLGVDELVSGTSTVTIAQSGGGDSFTYTFVNPISQVVTVTTVAGSAYASTGTADYFDIYSKNDELALRVYFMSGTAVAPSLTGFTGVEISISGAETADDVADEIFAKLLPYIEFNTSSPVANVITITNAEKGISTAPSESVVDAGFTVALTTPGNGEDIATRKVEISESASIGQRIEETVNSFVKVINRQDDQFVNGFYLSGTEDVPGQFMLEAIELTDTSFYVFCNDSDTTGEMFSDNLPDSGDAGYTTEVISDNEEIPNRVYYSKNQQPEAVPLLSYVDVGSKDENILRILPLRDSLFVFKSDGIYRITGEVYPNFSVRLFDASVKILAADSAAVLNNSILLVSDQGVVNISETGATIVSRRIEDRIVAASQKDSFSANTFGVGYEIDRAYLLFTVTNDSDTQSTQCLRYNTFTDSWTRFPIAKTCGIYNHFDQKLYLGSGDSNRVEKERKDFTRYDFADYDFELSPNAGSFNDDTIKVPSVTNISVGDAVVQTQYVTIYEFNRILKKLDIDSGLADADYFSTIGVDNGGSLAEALVALAAKLDADLGVASYSAIVAGVVDTNQSDIQTKFNLLVAALNADTTVIFSNYQTSSDTKTYEAIITAINNTTKILTMSDQPGYIQGAISIFKRIQCEVVYAPIHLNAPSVFKQLREASIFFEDKNFSTAYVGFSSDLDPSMSEQEFEGVGNGDFGTGVFGSSYPFGGSSDKTPFRTYVPRNKQRCRFIQIKFKHLNSRERFAIYGISVVGETYSEKAYK